MRWTPAPLVLFAAAALGAPATAQVLSLKQPSHRPAVSAGPVEEDVARAFALAFEDAVRYADRTTAESLIDVEALVARASAGVPCKEQVRKTFQAGAREGLSGEGGILWNLFNVRRAGGTLRFLRLDEREGERTALFRLVHVDGSAPEYIELVVTETDGVTRAVDVWTTAEGILHSRTLRRWLLALVADAGRSLPNRIAGEDRLFAQSGRVLERIDTAFEQGRNTDALAAWKDLPAEVRKDPAVVLARLRAALAAGPAAFDPALAEARAALPNEASIELLAIDAALLWNRTADAAAAVVTATDALDGDPYLIALRGGLLRTQGRLDDARLACQRAIELEPALEDAYWTWLAVSVLQKRWDETLALLHRMDERFEIDWSGLRASSAYAEFLDSPQGQRWRGRVARAR